MNILIGGTFPPGAVEMFLKLLSSNHNIEVVTDIEQFNKKRNVEVLITRAFKVTKEFIDQNKDLKFIQKWGSGLNTIDVAEAGKRGIPVSNVPGANAYAVSELTILLMLATYRNFLFHNRNMVKGIWTKAQNIESTYCLYKKTIGIIGGGHIGQLVAKKVSAFDAEVIYYDVFRQPEEVEKEYHMRYVTLDQLLKTSDVVTIHIPLNEKTRGFIGREQLKMMKPTSIIINSARGGLIVESDLIQALDEGVILGAGIDCIEHEPIDPKDPILKHEKVTLTPHVGGTSNDLLGEMVPRMAKNVNRFLKGEEPKSVANSEYLH